VQPGTNFIKLFITLLWQNKLECFFIEPEETTFKVLSVVRACSKPHTQKKYFLVANSLAYSDEINDKIPFFLHGIPLSIIYNAFTLPLMVR
jgi:hypothetical protein